LFSSIKKNKTTNRSENNVLQVEKSEHKIIVQLSSNIYKEEETKWREKEKQNASFVF